MREYSPESTQSIKISSSILMRLVGVAFMAWAGIVAWVGMQLIDRVDHLATAFNDYVVTMERRVTALEESNRMNQRK
jgi:hypothetical protein